MTQWSVKEKGLYYRPKLFLQTTVLSLKYQKVKFGPPKLCHNSKIFDLLFSANITELVRLFCRNDKH